MSTPAVVTPKPAVDPAKVGLAVLAVVAFFCGMGLEKFVTAWKPDRPPAPPGPAPEAVLRLTAGELYVFEAADPYFLLASPEGLVDLHQAKGPITVRAKFAGGSGKVETKVFPGPTVFTAEAAGTGRVELLAVKSGATGPADVTRKLVDAELAPQPPPKPPDPPKPPEPPAPQTGPLKVLIVYDSDPARRAKYTAGQREAMDSVKVLTYLNAHCAKGADGRTPEWRSWADNADASKESPVWQQVFARPRKSLPWLVVSNGTPAGYEGPLPGGVDEMLKLLQQYGGP
jgi:hypothetical protein